MLAFNRTCSKNKTSRHYYDSITKSIFIQIYCSILNIQNVAEKHIYNENKGMAMFLKTTTVTGDNTKTVLTTGRHKLFVSQQKQVRNGYVHGHC